MRPVQRAMAATAAMLVVSGSNGIASAEGLALAEDDLEAFSTGLIEMFLSSDETEIEAAEHHAIYGSLEQLPEDPVSVIETNDEVLAQTKDAAEVEDTP